MSAAPIGSKRLYEKDDTGTLLTFCFYLSLQAWSESLNHLKAQAKKAKDGTKHQDAKLASLSDALAQLNEAHQQAKARLAGSLGEVLAWQQQLHPEGVLQSAQGNDLQQLWAWQGSKAFDAGAVLKALGQNQQAVVQGLATACKRGMK